MAQHVTESIWHFAGYLHISDLLGYTPVSYMGAPVQRLSGYTPQESEAGDAALKLTLPDKSRPLAFQEPPIPSEFQRADLVPHAGEAVQPISPATWSGLPFTPLLGNHAPIDNSASFGVELPEIKVQFSYTEIPAYLADIAFYQSNVVFDGDALLGEAAMLADGSGQPADATGALARMIANAEELISARAFPDLAPEGGDGDVRIDDGDLATIDTAGHSGADVQEVSETSHYVNGARIDDPATAPDANEAIAAQAEQIRAAVEDFNPEEEELASPAPIIDGDGREVIHVVTDGTPAGGYTQQAVTGQNEALNIAVLDDRSDAFASLIIEGDYRETNAIIQINVLEDDDIFVSGAAIAEEIALGRNALTNDAQFVADPGAVVGDGRNGFSGAVNWQVTYVTGDYWDIAALSQRNVLIDGDLAQQTSANTHMTALLGSNGQLNFIELSQASAEYDLIIIGGDYYDLNTILQINLLMDEDAVLQALGGSGAQTGEVNGNTLLNDAAIVNIGSESFQALEGSAADLAQAVAEKQEIVDAETTLGIPGNGTGTLKVLYVAGDYYDLDVIVQTNIILDPDAVEQAALDGADENGRGEEMALDQAAVSGGNAAINLALIIDVDSLSGYQYLGGEQYEETLLVQANILSDEDEIDVGRDLHPDVVAAVAAMSDDDGVAISDSTSDYAASPSHHGADVLGSVMS